MASVRRHVPLLLRVWIAAAVFGYALSATRLEAQNGPPAGGQDSAAGQPPSVTPLPVSAQPPAAPQERVLDIRIVGNHTISRDKVLANIGTRIDRPFDQATFEKDIRKLSAKNWFIHVHPLPREHVPGGVIITLEVVERPIQQFVRFLGNKKIKKKALEKEAGIKKGDPLDIYAVQDGQRKIESYYQSKGYNDVKVHILEGTKPGDRGTIYLINEGSIQKFHSVTFEGNSKNIAPDGRLKTLIQSKPPLFGIFKGQYDRKKVTEDEEKLTDYYRSLGFFKAHVGHDYEFNETEDRVNLVFYIVEGPRYKVRSIAFLGNKVYPEQALSFSLKLKQGAFYDRAKMNTDIGGVKDLYGSNGYVFADCAFDLRFLEEPGELDLVYKVNEGKQYRIGDITIQIKGDNSHTRYSTVLNRLSMRPGDIADIRQFRSSERRLKASGLYNVDPSKGDTPKIVFAPPESDEGGVTGKKQRGTARATGNPDSFRGQSPDDSPVVNIGASVSVAAPASGGQIPSETPTSTTVISQAGPPRQWASPSPAAPVAPVQPGAPAAGMTVRFQSPDGPYGSYQGGNNSGYGGRAVNPVSPSPQPYTVNQAPPVYGTQPPPGYNNSQPPYATPQPTPANPYGPGAGYAQGPPGGPGGYVAPEAVPPGQSPPLFPPGGAVTPGGSALSNQAPEMGGPPLLPVIVTMNEAQTGKFMFGAGVNSNAGLVGSIVLDEQNFDWQRTPNSWEDIRNGQAFRGAGQKFRIEAAPGTQVSRYMINFTEPYLFDTPVGLGLSGYYFNRFYRDWTEQRAGGRASLLYQFTPDLSGNLALRAEDIRISQPRVLGVPPLDAVLGHTQLYSLKGQLAHDTRDNTFLATEGHYIEADFEYAGGTFQFPRFTSNFRQHFLLYERPDGSGRQTLSFYNQFGISGKDTPLYENFFAGGFGTLRGFQFRGASPMLDTVEVGGILENLTSVEYMFPLTADDMLKGVTFVDFGTVETTYNVNWNNFRIAPGLGLRITLPMISMAPIALDFAVPIRNAPGDLKQVFSFFVGVGH